MLRRIVAIIALVHILVFSVTLILLFIDINMFKGLDYLVAYSGGIGIALYFYIYLDNKFTEKEQQTLQKLNEKQEEAQAPLAENDEEPK